MTTANDKKMKTITFELQDNFGGIEIKAGPDITSQDVFTAIAYGVVALVEQDYPGDKEQGLKNVIAMLINGTTQALGLEPKTKAEKPMIVLN
jgi:hypothetical protein